MPAEMGELLFAHVVSAYTTCSGLARGVLTIVNVKTRTRGAFIQSVIIDDPWLLDLISQMISSEPRSTMVCPGGLRELSRRFSVCWKLWDFQASSLWDGSVLALRRLTLRPISVWVHCSTVVDGSTLRLCSITSSKPPHSRFGIASTLENFAVFVKLVARQRISGTRLLGRSILLRFAGCSKVRKFSYGMPLHCCCALCSHAVSVRARFRLALSAPCLCVFPGAPTHIASLFAVRSLAKTKKQENMRFISSMFEGFAVFVGPVS